VTCGSTKSKEYQKKKQELWCQQKSKLIFMMTPKTVYAVRTGYATTVGEMMYSQYERRIYQHLRVGA